MLIGPATDGSLHVMTYNLRHDDDPPPNDWPTRLDLIGRLIDIEQPGLLGTQEALYNQLRDLERRLPDYDTVWLSREGGSHGESMAVFYRPDRLTPLEFAHQWLSDTPLSMGSTSWGNEVPRMLTWVRFKDAQTGDQFRFINTHFDHISAPSRVRSAQLIRALAVDCDEPVIVSGDFNDGPDTPPYTALLDKGSLTDTWRQAEDRLTPRHATYNNWDPEAVEGAAIDWILTSAGVRTLRTGINTQTWDGLPPSDHWPVQAELILP